MKKCCVFVIFLLFLCNVAAAEQPGSVTGMPQQISTEQYILYIPSKIDPEENYPLVVAFSSAAQAETVVDAWKMVAERYKWFIYSDKISDKGVDIYQDARRAMKNVLRLLQEYPLDRKRIVSSGFSGGTVTAHALAFLYPEVFKIVVANTGMMHEKFLKQGWSYPKRKKAVFIASSTDIRYSEMKRDRDFLDAMQWQTAWIEFDGGHKVAPWEVYMNVADWILEQWR